MLSADPGIAIELLVSSSMGCTDSGCRMGYKCNSHVKNHDSCNNRPVTTVKIEHHTDLIVVVV